jgi:alpha-galactosidase
MYRKTVASLLMVSTWSFSALAAERPVASLPAHLAESGVPTQGEIDLVGTWLEAIVADEAVKNSAEAGLDDWIGTELPFGFQYGGKDFASLAGVWKFQHTEPKQEGNVQTWERSWTDPETALKATWRIKRFLDYPAVEWTLSFVNPGDKAVAVEQVTPLDLRLGTREAEKPCIVRGANGGRSAADDLMPVTWALESDGTASGPISLGGDASPSNVHLPFWSLQTPEQRGAVVGVGAAGWWRADIARDGERLACKVMGPDQGTLKIEPNQNRQTARVLVSLWKGKWLHGHNVFRRLLYTHYVPALRGESQKPLVSVNVCFTHHGGGLFLEKVTEKHVLSLIEPFARLGAELLIIDAGWYSHEGQKWFGPKNDWRPDPEKYPQGFTRIAGRLREKGIDFGLWMNAPDEPARDAAFLDRVDDLVNHQGLTCYRQDITPTNREVIDTLRRRYPRLVMEGCCGGGRNIDLETISRFHWHQKSDRWFDTFSDHCGLYGANLFLPGGVINVPTQATDNFGVWSSFGGQLCLAWHPLDQDFPLEKAKRQVELYKRVRPFLSGDFYPLTECTPAVPWLAYQFHRTDLNQGFALIFKRAASAGDSFVFAPKSLDPQTRYVIRCEGSGLEAVYAGAELAKGIPLVLKNTPQAELVIYEKQP